MLSPFERRDEALHIPGDLVHLEIHPSTDSQLPKRGDSLCVRDDIDTEGSALHLVHRQTHSIHRDRPLARDIPGEVRRNRNFQPRGARVAADGNDLGHTIDVTRYQMSS